MKCIYFSILFLSILWNFQFYAYSLDELACQFGTDKSSKFHNYTVIYESYFSSLRKKPINFLEIGIEGSTSVKMWDNYFEHPKAVLNFIDIESKWVNGCHELVMNHELTDRVCPYEVDQGNKSQLSNFCSKINGKFDIIIDDGGHTMEQQITSFCFLFPYVACGGVYVIEDLHTSFFPMFGGGGSLCNTVTGQETTLHFLMRLIEDVNYIGSITSLGDVYKCADSRLKNYYQRHIKSMHFYNSICFIFKY